LENKSKAWKFIGEGNDRKVYQLPSGNVIKIPIPHTNGEFVNCREDYLWKNRINYDEQFARCRLIPGTFLLVMEFVKTFSCSSDYKNLPNWCSYIDCSQVGLNKKGKLVAYDYG